MIDTKNFTREEFNCRCCGENRMHQYVIETLQKVRDEFGHPIKVTSGWRCPENNAESGGSTNSSHMAGLAIDVEVKSSFHRYNFLLTAMKYFDRIGVAEDFIHIDMDPNKTSKLLWLY